MKRDEFTGSTLTNVDFDPVDERRRGFDGRDRVLRTRGGTPAMSDERWSVRPPVRRRACVAAGTSADRGPTDYRSDVSEDPAT